MRLEDLVKNSPLLKKALAAGEAQVGKALGTLLASDGLSGGLRALASGAAQARDTLEKGVQQALHAANLPSRDDVAALRRRLDELETLLDGLAAKVDAPPRRREGGGHAP
jgi:ABC-type transporter Mla subunit MlaD